MPESNPSFVSTPEDLAALVDQLACGPALRLGLDTEFHAERRYEPELMLVQLAVPDGESWIIDARSVDLHPLGPELSRHTWVAHGCRTDLFLLSRFADARPAALIDTQVMAAMTGFVFPIRLSDLATTVLQREMDRYSTLSDWSRRPLSPAQLRYAADDALIVLELADRLSKDLPAERHAWVEAAGAELLTEALTPVNTDLEWRALEVSPILDADARRVMQTLYRWRWKRAGERDQPPHHVMGVGVALDLARRRPSSLEELKANRLIPTGLAKRHGQKLVDLIRNALETEAPAPVQPAIRARRRALALWAEAVAPAHALAPSLLLPVPLAERVAADGSSAWTGWRREALGDELDAFLAGHTSLAMGATGPRVVNRGA